MRTDWSQINADLICAGLTLFAALSPLSIQNKNPSQMVVYGNGLQHRRYLNAYSMLNVISSQGGIGAHKTGEPLFYGQVLGMSIGDEFAVSYIGNKNTQGVLL